jgi:hypothetical protein
MTDEHNEMSPNEPPARTRTDVFVEGLAAALKAFSAGLELSVVGLPFRLVGLRAETPRESVSEAIEALQSASAVVQRLEADLQSKTGELQEIQAEYARLEQLAAVEAEKAEPILGAVEHTLGKGRRREYAAAFVINAVVAAGFFFLGLWVGN